MHCSHECKNSKCECGKCKCKEGSIGKCCQFKDCEKGLCPNVEERDCGGIGHQACSGNRKWACTIYSNIVYVLTILPLI